jgi:bifunctional non-homologous end joining protein LigD
MATKKSATKSTTRKRDPHTTAASSAVDAQLERYRSMRDFSTTDEPSGAGANTNTFAMRKPTTSRGLPFVIQKHAASHLHYDFRLSWGGVLKSWAIAKGPSYNPQERRLAIEVEDHPLEYGGFEGIIPQGQYGGGTVMIWDQGSWWPQLGSENVDACLRAGHLKFEMNGSKMKGKWALIRMNHAAQGPKDKPQWLLIKEHDKYERGPNDPAITDERPNSSVTGRSIDQIAHAQDHVWNSNRSDPLESAQAPTPKPATKKSAATSAKKSTPSPPPTPSIDLRDLPRERQPDFISPQLAFEAESTPNTDEWIHELKLDGYRIQARKSGNQVQLLTRKGIDWTHRMPDIAKAVANLPVRDCTLDGEVVVLSTDGNSSFALLQASFQNAETHPLAYFVFDLLHIDGHDPRDLSLRERKDLLSPLLPPDDETIRLSEDIPGNGETVFRKACALHAEGIISKRADAPYRSTRSSDWLKSKCLHEQELVIAGFTLSSEGPDRVGALLLGYYPPVKRGPKTPRHLIYAGRTGTGFTQKARRDLLTQLVKLRVPESAFQRIPHDATRDVFWVRPTLVAQVRFATWTSDNLVRQAAFLGLREDKAATEVVRESATVAPKPKRSSAKHTKPAHAATKPSKPAKPRTHATHRTATLQHFALTPTKSPRSKTPNPMLPKPSPAKKSSPTKSTPTKSTRAKLAAQNPGAPEPALSSSKGLASETWNKPATNLRPKPTAAPDLRLTHPDKILDPTSGLTKQQLADYYAIAADRMLPYIANRPLSLVRCPQGAGKPCFFQKHVNNYLPPGIKTIDIQDKTSAAPEPYITLDTTEALVSLAQMNVLEIHPWGSTNDDLEHPDRLIFDLDPDAELPWLTVAAAAAEVRQRLKNLGIESFLKLTGGKGLHIVAPIQPTLTWPELKTAAHNFVLSMERENPDLYLTKMTKSSRVGRIFLDYLRNQRGATAVAPYSPRARVGATISLPLPWTALNRDVHPVLSVYDVAASHTKLRADPWKAFLTTHQQLHPKQFAVL